MASFSEAAPPPPPSKPPDPSLSTPLPPDPPAPPVPPDPPPSLLLCSSQVSASLLLATPTRGHFLSTDVNLYLSCSSPSLLPWEVIIFSGGVKIFSKTVSLLPLLQFLASRICRSQFSQPCQKCLPFFIGHIFLSQSWIPCCFSPWLKPLPASLFQIYAPAGYVLLVLSWNIFVLLGYIDIFGLRIFCISMQLALLPRCEDLEMLSNDISHGSSKVAYASSKTSIYSRVLLVQAVTLNDFRVESCLIQLPLHEDVTHLPFCEDVTQLPLCEDVTKLPLCEDVTKLPLYEDVTFFRPINRVILDITCPSASTLEMSFLLCSTPSSEFGARSVLVKIIETLVSSLIKGFTAALEILNCALVAVPISGDRSLNVFSNPHGFVSLTNLIVVEFRGLLHDFYLFKCFVALIFLSYLPCLVLRIVCIAMMV